MRRGPRLPIILITGHADTLSRSPPIGLRTTRLFKKPFDGEELLSVLSARPSANASIAQDDV